MERDCSAPCSLSAGRFCSFDDCTSLDFDAFVEQHDLRTSTSGGYFSMYRVPWRRPMTELSGKLALEGYSRSQFFCQPIMKRQRHCSHKIALVESQFPAVRHLPCQKRMFIQSFPRSQGIVACLLTAKASTFHQKVQQMSSMTQTPQANSNEQKKQKPTHQTNKKQANTETATRVNCQTRHSTILPSSTVCMVVVFPTVHLPTVK